jgi:hypothetical protein
MSLLMEMFFVSLCRDLRWRLHKKMQSMDLRIIRW